MSASHEPAASPPPAPPRKSGEGSATIDRLGVFLFESARWRFLTCLLGLMLVKTGIGVIGNINYSLLLSKNPFVNPIVLPENQYVVWNWLGSFLGWVVGATRPGTFAGLHLLFAAGFVALFVHLAFRRLEEPAARVAILLFVLLPASATSLYWIGYDSLTLPLMLIALAYPGGGYLAAFAGVLLGMQHFEQGVFGGGALLFAACLQRLRGEAPPARIAHLVMWLAGVVVGKVALVLIFHFNGIVLEGGRLIWTWQHLPRLFNEFLMATQYIVWSIFGVGWLAAIKFAEQGRNRLAFFLALLGLSLLLPISGDETRVIVIVTFPLVCAYWLFDGEFLRSITRREASVAFLVWAMAPWPWVWEGSPQLSQLPRDLFFGL